MTESADLDTGDTRETDESQPEESSVEADQADSQSDLGSPESDTADPPADESKKKGAAHFRTPQIDRHWFSYLVMALGAAFVLALAAYQMFGLHQLDQVVEYDDGCYFGAALRMSEGILPYRSFVLAQPPLVPILMLPFAFLSRLTGTRVGLEVARCTVPFFQAGCVVLAGMVVRHRGRVATTTAVAVTAFFPVADVWDRTVMLEPFCLLFCVLGILFLFDRDAFSSGKRLWWAGIFFGLGGCCKAFALLPFIPLLLALVIYRRRVGDVARFVVGAGIPVLLIVGPFFLASPARFIRQAVMMQLVRTQPALPNHIFRSQLILDIVPNWEKRGIFAPYMTRGLVVVASCLAGVVLLGLVIRGFRTRRWLSAVDIGILLAVGATFVGLLTPAAYYLHYVTFFTAIFGALLGLALGSIAGLFPSRGWRWWLLSVPGVLVLAALVLAGGVHTSRAVKQFNTHYPFSPQRLEALIPPKACVVSDNPSLVILANRFQTDDPHCPKMLDSYGTTLSVTDGLSAASPKAATGIDRKVWLKVLRNSDYVVLTFGFQDKRIPWSSPVLRHYLESHFSPHYLSGYHQPAGPAVWSRNSADISSRV